MHVDSGRSRLHGPDDIRVCRPPQRRVDATLQADLRGAESLGLCGALSDLLEGQGEGVGVGPALGEGAEAAADVTDVGEVDVAVDDVGDVLTDDVTPHVVGQRGHRLKVGAIAGEQRQVVVVAQSGWVILSPEQGRPDIGVEAR